VATPRHVCHACPAMPDMPRDGTNMALMPTEEHGEFTRLSAGGSRLRTLGPRYMDDAFETILVSGVGGADPHVDPTVTALDVA